MEGVTSIPDGRLAGERFQRPSPRLWQARQMELGAAALVSAIALVALSWGVAGLGAAVGALVVVVVVVGVAWVALRGRVRSWGYLEREDDLLVRRGLLVRRSSVIPYGRMQYVDVTAGPVERWLGLATVRLHTAAAATDARIPGLAKTEADRLRDRLASSGEARATGL